MANCKACGAWFSSTAPSELCPRCERALHWMKGETMAEYIEREEIYRRWKDMPAPGCLVSLAAAISQTPASDVAPMVHGRWYRPLISGTKRKNPFCYCTNCAYPVKPKRASKYCPSCGAKMDLEV